MLKYALNGHFKVLKISKIHKKSKNQSSVTIHTYILGIPTNYIPTKFEENLIITFGINEKNLLS